jgi:NAD(P)-dependent dehydrogenase (short-subunit alcohol dehydrogenase family)
MDGVVIITGAGEYSFIYFKNSMLIDAASGIGRDTAFMFAERGATGMILTDIDEAGATKVADEAKEYATSSEFRALALAMDVTSHESVQKGFSQAMSQFERIDYGVHCAGVS